MACYPETRRRGSDRMAAPFDHWEKDQEVPRSRLGMDGTVATKQLSPRDWRAEARRRSAASVGIPREQKVLCRRRLRGFAVIRVQQTAQELFAAYVESLVR